MPYLPVEVITRPGHDDENLPAPLNFRWLGRTFMIEEIGRRWNDIQGSHILVLTFQRQTFELVFNPEHTGWSLNSDKVPPVMV